MSYNPIVRGLNAISKVIGQGYARVALGGFRIRFCRVYTEPAQNMKVSTSLSLNMKVSTE